MAATNSSEITKGKNVSSTKKRPVRQELRNNNLDRLTKEVFRTEALEIFESFTLRIIRTTPKTQKKTTFNRLLKKIRILFLLVYLAGINQTFEF